MHIASYGYRSIVQLQLPQVTSSYLQSFVATKILAEPALRIGKLGSYLGPHSQRGPRVLSQQSKILLVLSYVHLLSNQLNYICASYLVSRIISRQPSQSTHNPTLLKLFTTNSKVYLKNLCLSLPCMIVQAIYTTKNMLVTKKNAIHAFILPITVPTKQEVTQYNNN